MKIAAPASHRISSGVSRSTGASIGTGDTGATSAPSPKPPAAAAGDSASSGAGDTVAGDSGCIQDGSVTGGNSKRASGRNHSA